MSSPCLLSRSSFSVAKVLMALCVFFCHVFEPLNEFGFLFVSVFFFMSGFGLERGHRRFSSLTRCIPLLLIFAWFTALYGLFYGKFLFPCSWYMYVYFGMMVLYRFCPGVYSLLFASCLFAAVLSLLGFNWVWYASLGAFVFGVFFARKPSLFILRNVLVFLPLILLVPGHMAALWAVLPLFSYIVLSLSSRPWLRFLSGFSPYTKYFYLCHVFCLGIFGATWTLGGEPSFITVVPSFCLSILFSFFLADFLFKYPKGA